jgi:hypothetical protein
MRRMRGPSAGRAQAPARNPGATLIQPAVRGPSACRRLPGRDAGLGRYAAGRQRNHVRDAPRAPGAGSGRNRDAAAALADSRSCRRSSGRDAFRYRCPDRAPGGDRNRNAGPHRDGGLRRAGPGRPEQARRQRGRLTGGGLDRRHPGRSRYGLRLLRSHPGRCWSEPVTGAWRSRRAAVTRTGSGAPVGAAACCSLPDQILPVVTAGYRCSLSSVAELTAGGWPRRAVRPDRIVG